MATNKGFIKDINGNKLLPITRAELVLDSNGKIALTSEQFAAGGNNPWGLISAEERALLTGTNGGDSVTSLSTKLSYINSGLYVNNKQLNFYSIGENNNVTSTPVTISNSNDILVTTASNTITFALNEILSEEKNITNFVKGITVDKQGRITTITGSDLNNNDIPATLTGKTLDTVIIKNSKLDSTITDNSDELAIVNKSYLDNKLQQYSGIASGALKFIGTLEDKSYAESLLNENHVNEYYKVTAEFTLSSNYIHNQELDINVKTGDTLIIHKMNNNIKYVYIPSGDERTTTLTFKQGTNSSNSLIGSIQLEFSDQFNIINTSGSNTVNIDLKKADSTQDGYLSKEDYAKFSTYAAKTITYTPTLTSGYEIGKLNLGDSGEITIYGKDTISTLTLTNGSDSKNPYFTFNSGNSSETFTFEGINGIKITKKSDSNTIQFQSANEASTDNNYLTIEHGYQFKINKGSFDSNTNTVTQGITDYDEFNTFRQASIAAHAAAVHYDVLNYSLTDSSKEYYYGGEKLKTAIQI